MVTIINSPTPRDNSDTTTTVLGILIAVILIIAVYFFMIAPAWRRTTVPAQTEAPRATQPELNVPAPTEKTLEINVNSTGKQ